MTLQIGIVGTGWFSKVHGDTLASLDGVRVTGVTGTTAAKAQALADRYPGAIGFGNLTDMLDSLKLDAVYLCIPPMAHGEIETELIERGIPFFVEKPLAADLETPQRILSRLEQKPLVHAVGYHFRYKESIRQLKESLEGRKIGMALGTWMGDMPQVAWWRSQEGSGGQFVEQTTHIVDLLRYTAGEVREVYAAYGNRMVQERFDNVTVPDVGTVTMKLQSGAVATISNTCILPGGVSEVGLKLYTDAGILSWSPERLEIDLPGTKTAYTGKDNPYLAETEAFIHALRTGDTSRILSDYADAVKTQQITCAALESARTGNPVCIGE
ncbi:oxidoreductase, NAD-binding domain protein [Paenibacillus sp. oral taxon 786 str. D14]|uniref:Gfo/Idh/MocA family protein n=1 Tax=Paenibacillus sp. oral taxon 786 TaxID=652715 RepID=UPI0001AFCE6B|nr:Gfo/Idh/MocA family oxidoreductase [Paenibacillus sp. oral taxon 786]EES74658.1 oxidoreductase, NAD-binding domain protein [Paenibacillus sp. oral taxon 786 str. D14]